MKLKTKFCLLLSVFFVLNLGHTGHACTAFSIKKGDTLFYGENFDWHVKEGLVVVNKRGVRKTPQVFGANDQKIAAWTSKYGSITFNTLGREYLHGGMNSKGLFVTGLTLKGSQYPPIDSRPAVTHAQYKQYFLDNCATVEEVMGVQSHIRVFARNQKYPVHFFIGDTTGRCAVIEFLDGQMIVHKGAGLSTNVLSNSEYAYAVDYLKEHDGFGGSRALPENRTNSLDRFVRAAAMVQSYHLNPSASYVDYGFDILKSVSQGKRSVWTIVYDVSNMRIYFRTMMNKNLQYIDMKSFDFSCATPSLALDLNNTFSGDVAGHFETYTQEMNREFILRMTQYYTLPETILSALLTHQYGIFCAKQ